MASVSLVDSSLVSPGLVKRRRLSWPLAGENQRSFTCYDRTMYMSTFLS